MLIQYINNDGAGFADQREVREGTTVGDFFNAVNPGASDENYLIRVNRQIVARSTVLQAGDKVSVTPKKIDGAIVVA